jgi:hypothetical protein
MALRLLYERHLGQESTLKEYIRVLPSYIPSLIHYSSEELAELQDPELEDRARRTQQSARAKFDRVAPAIATPPTWATWLWALTNAHSRTFKFATVAGDVAFGMIPLADMLNHRFSGTSFRVDHARGAFEITASRGVARGAEVTVSYGAADNAELLHTYGFVDRDNDMDAARVAAAALAAARCAPEGSADAAAAMMNRLRPRLQALEQMHGSNGYADRTRTHTYTRAHTRTHTHAYTRARTRARTRA